MNPIFQSDEDRPERVARQFAEETRLALRRHWDYPLSPKVHQVARKCLVVSAEDYKWMMVHAKWQAEDRQKRQEAEAWYNDPQNIIYT